MKPVCQSAFLRVTMLNAITLFSIGACIVFLIRTTEAAAVVSKEDCPEKFSSLSGTESAKIIIKNSTQTTAITIDSKSIVSTTESTTDDITSVFPKGAAEMSTVSVKELATSVPVTTASSTIGQTITTVSETTFTTSARPTSARPTSARPTSARPTSASPTSASSTSARPTSASPTSASPTSASSTSASSTTILSTTFSTSTPSSTTTSTTEQPHVPESECHDSSMFCSGFRRLCNAPRGCTRRRQSRSLPLNRQDDEIACVWVRMQKSNPALGLAINECDDSLRRPQLNLGVHAGSYQSRMNMSPRRPRRLDCGVHKIVSSVFAALCPASCGECD